MGEARFGPGILKFGLITQAPETHMQLKDISVLVTGGGSGLGEATARAMAAKGAKVAVIDMN
ncbi:SDR family NAD(P)-dependent oxidoreductase, partial [Acinetobacter johnsonii]|uniref:SDR family NAD(P)-dependent oxidoreductase n=1 Tax=Acinetobacter johnsonii TaxID=40214 RepID=UPI003016A915